MKEKLLPLTKRLYILVALVSLFWQVPRLLEIDIPRILQYAIDGVWALTALLGLTVCALYRERSVRITVYGLLWIGATLFLRGGMTDVIAGGQTIANGIYAFLVCYPLGLILDRKDRERVTDIILGGWSGVMAVLCVAGLCSIVTGTTIRSVSGVHYIGMNPRDHRLYLLAYCTDTGGFLAMSILMALLGVLRAKKPLCRCLYGAAIILETVCLSMTDGRSSYLALGAALGLACAVPLTGRMRDGKLLPRLAVLGGLAAAGAVAVYLIMPQLMQLINRFAAVPEQHTLELKQLLPIASAAAEGSGAAAHRSILNGNALSGRTNVWESLFLLIRDNPRILLTGTTVLDYKQSVLPYTTTGLQYAHMHSIFLQTLMELGIPGLLLLLTFLAAFIRSTLRLMLDNNRPVRERLLPLTAIMILIGELVECHTLLMLNLPLMPVLYLFMGLTVAAERTERRVP